MYLYMYNSTIHICIFLFLIYIYICINIRVLYSNCVFCTVLYARKWKVAECRTNVYEQTSSQDMNNISTRFDPVKTLDFESCVNIMARNAGLTYEIVTFSFDNFI